MTIDEAIAKYNKLANNDRTCYPEEAQQIAEWLEELKSSRQELNELRKYSYVQGHSDGYNNAIDDFAEKLKSECREHYIDCDPYFGGITDSILYEDDIEEIAEQLKAGKKDEQSI